MEAAKVLAGGARPEKLSGAPLVASWVVAVLDLSRIAHPDVVVKVAASASGTRVALKAAPVPVLAWIEQKVAAVAVELPLVGESAEPDLWLQRNHSTTGLYRYPMLASMLPPRPPLKASSYSWKLPPFQETIFQEMR